MAKTLRQQQRWDMELGSSFLQYAQYTEASLLQHFCKCTRQCYTNLHASIATLCCRIVVWKRQGTFLLDYHDTLMETCSTRKTKFLGSIPAYFEPSIDAGTYRCRR